MSFGLALRTFFRILRDSAFAEDIRRLDGDSETARQGPERNPALTLLAALQREARFVDFVKESLDAYSDAQVGAAARDVHRDCAAVVDRVFGVEPLRAEDEDSEVTIPAGFDTALVRLTGNVTGQPPHRGVLRHAGWRATRCAVPEWTGGGDAAMAVAPAEVEL